MSYVFELTLDPDAEAAIRAIWQRISDAGHPSSLDAQGYRPHISLAVYDTDHFDAHACYQNVAAYARRTTSFPIHLSHLGIFVHWGNVVFLGVTPSEMLLARQQEVLALCRSQQEYLRPYYVPGLWTPHVTLSFQLTRQQTLEIAQMGWEMALPFSGQVQALHLIEVTPDTARDIFTCEFTG